MTEKITKEIFDHMVELAALELDETESQYLRKELNNQLLAIEELSAFPITDEIVPAAHGVPYPAEISAPIREDNPKAFADPDLILENAPEIEDRYFIVPDIKHEDLK
jgi:aspartyl-tRNA(Asn)/glutamyl-tRNA(Gln) amidotransferase subunit C